MIISIDNLRKALVRAAEEGARNISHPEEIADAIIEDVAE